MTAEEFVSSKDVGDQPPPSSIIKKLIRSADFANFYFQESLPQILLMFLLRSIRKIISLKAVLVLVFY